MNRRTMLAFLGSLPFASYLGFQKPEMKLYEFVYAKCDEPCCYTAYSGSEALEAFTKDGYDRCISMREIPMDEIIVYGEENEKGIVEKKKETVSTFLSSCYHPNCCVLCDAHYC